MRGFFHGQTQSSEASTPTTRCRVVTLDQKRHWRGSALRPGARFSRKAGAGRAGTRKPAKPKPAQGARLFEGALNRGADPDHPRPGVGPEHRADLGDAEGARPKSAGTPLQAARRTRGRGCGARPRRRAVGVNAPSPGPLRRSKGEACSGSAEPPRYRLSSKRALEAGQTMRRPVHPPGVGRGPRGHAWSEARGSPSRAGG